MLMKIKDLLMKLFSQRCIEIDEDAEAAIQSSAVSEAIEYGLVVQNHGRLCLKNPLDFLILLANKGLGFEEYLKFIEWKEFEDFIAKVFEEYGFEVLRNYVYSGFKRFQIDVLAIDVASRRGFVIECKHWSRLSNRKTALIQAVERHLQRVKLLDRYCEWLLSIFPAIRKAAYFIPVIVTLHRFPEKVIMSVPIVSVIELRDFVSNIDEYLEELSIARIPCKCYSSR